jgi:LysR family glycine cleavage system transcriptional activator
MHGLLPPLGGLRAFEAVARHGSVTLAARELGVTPGAVSLRVKELEAALGVPLFLRRPRALSLTPDGQAYFATVRTSFRLLREATAEVAARARAQVLTVSCTPAFATQWLVPRLPRFEGAAPGVEVRIAATNRLVDFARDGVDLAIRHGPGRYDGLASERLLDDDLIPVLAPGLAPSLAGPGGATPPTPPDLRSLTLLHDEHRHDWRLWLEAAGAEGVDWTRGPVFTDGNGAIEAARAGLGVALARASLVARELAEGALVAPFPQGVASGLAHHLVYPPGAMDRPAAAAFRDWALAEAGRTPSAGGAPSAGGDLRPARPPGRSPATG